MGASKAADGDLVAQVRSFNRFYTRVIGVLTDGLVGTPYSLTEARVLFELAQRDTIDSSELRRLLDLDAGYLSRILAGFVAGGLVGREQSAADARHHVARLTETGRAAFAVLDEHQIEAVEQLLAPLSTQQRTDLVSAMGTIRRELGDTPRPQGYVLRPPEPGELGWVVSRHGAVYAAEYGWDASFEALVARVIADYLDGHDPKREAAWIAEVDGEPAGSVFCVAGDASTAKLRLLLVEPSARGMGIGARLVEECLRFARRAGYSRITLWTVDALTGARRIYEHARFHLDEQAPHHSFGHDIVGQIWSREL
ncbi:MAG: GNAT family N-acetyltransferase [Pseudonocardiaceae bacterium]|nr:GNAT family N-acetyltransferase [Pseudonocardiaceae bacterium]